MQAGRARELLMLVDKLSNLQQIQAWPGDLGDRCLASSVTRGLISVSEILREPRHFTFETNDFCQRNRERNFVTPAWDTNARLMPRTQPPPVQTGGGAT
jgi:hypothetical protein